MAAGGRSYTGGRFAFSVGTDAAAVVSKVEPGAAELDVADIQYSTSNIIGKQTTNMKWGEWKVSLGIGMSKGLHDLINAAMDQQAAPFSGQISIADFNFKEQRLIQFHDALITSVGLSKLEAKGKAAFSIDVGFIPERVDYAPGSGADIRGKLGPAQKSYSTNNYRVSIGDLPCKRVTEVDALKWTVKTALEYTGEAVLPTLHCAKVERPELTITLSAADAEPFEKHFHSFAIQGKRLVADELSGSIELLDPALGEAVATIELKQMGWKKFAADAYEANKEGTSQVKCTFWVEDSDLRIHKFDA
jgi:hypothetical protein